MTVETSWKMLENGTLQPLMQTDTSRYVEVCTVYVTDAIITITHTDKEHVGHNAPFSPNYGY